MPQSDRVLKLVIDRFEAQSRRLDHQDVLLKDILGEARATNDRVAALEGGQRDIQRRADERDGAARARSIASETAARERSRRRFDWRIAALPCVCLLASGAITELLRAIT